MKQPYDSEIIEKIRQHLLKTHTTVAVAESVTSGHIQVALSQGEQAMFFSREVLQCITSFKNHNILI